jgi:hypothetical protein
MRHLAGEAGYVPYRLRCGDQVAPGWHRRRDDALRQGQSRGWTIQNAPGCYSLADGVELEEQVSRPTYPR